MSDKESRTEAATPTRLTKAVDENGAAVSRELATLASLGAVLLLGIVMIPVGADHLGGAMAHMFETFGQTNSLSGVARESRQLMIAAGEIIVPLACVVTVAAVLATVLQNGFRVNSSAVRLHFDKLNPLSGLTSILSTRHMAETGQSIVKLVGLGVAVYLVVSSGMPRIVGSVFQPAQDLPAMILNMVVAIFGAAVLIQFVVAATDFVLVRRQFSTQNRMSQEEIKDEQKEIEGDPAVRARLKALRNLQAKRNLKIAMARATVVVTNPTHYAVALEYRTGQAEAPRIVAKGADEQAARIRELAQESRIPIVPNPPLARALFGQDVDTEITPEHYRAVAEVIAYIWKLAERRKGAS